jgi:MinD superfamily P-loop ATPase
VITLLVLEHPRKTYEYIFLISHSLGCRTSSRERSRNGFRLKEIAVVSGKGGVGKSSLTASLAVLLSKAGTRVTAIDSDVDAPNLSIILGADISHFSEIQASEKASIDRAKCDRCGICLSACKADALWGDEGEPPRLIPFLCEGCGACAVVCPRSAITINRVKNGKIGYAQTAYGFPIVSGQLDMGESSSGHIVSAVKAKGRTVAQDSASDVVLVDGPPGIGCPVIASVAGADYALVVTEPTPAARNSMDRMLTVLAHFKIPASVIVNRFDLDPEYTRKIEDHVQAKWSISVAQKIPSDENVPLSLSKRTPVVEFQPDCDASRALRVLSDHVMRAI